MGVSLLCLSLGLTLGQRQDFGAPPIVGLFAAALAIGAGFVALQLRRSNPLIDLRILRAPLLSVSVIAGFATFAASSATIFLLPFYLQGLPGYAAVEIGLLLAVAPVAMGQLAGRRRPVGSVRGAEADPGRSRYPLRGVCGPDDA